MVASYSKHFPMYISIWCSSETKGCAAMHWSTAANAKYTRPARPIEMNYNTIIS